MNRSQTSAAISAPLEARIVEKGLATDAVVIDTVVSKYCDHLPLYRQAAILEREAGLEIGRATLNGWVMRVGELPVKEYLTAVLPGLHSCLIMSVFRKRLSGNFGRIRMAAVATKSQGFAIIL